MREHEFPKRLEDLMFNFEEYLNIFNCNVPFNKYGQFEFHLKTIEMRNSSTDALSAVKDPNFIKQLWNVLKAWGIGSRGSHLVAFSDFMASLQDTLREYQDLDVIRIDGNGNSEKHTIERICSLVDSLSIVNNKTKIVPCSKALHHIYPNLIVPMDRRYTQAFFMIDNQEFQDNQFKVLKNAIKTFMRIARSIKPEKYVGKGWNTSQTKVIDNAIIGFCLSNKIA